MSRAWIDDEDEAIDQEIRESRPFLLNSATQHLPEWATAAAASLGGTTEGSLLVEDVVGHKRGRTQELEDVLTSTAPLLSSRNQRRAAIAPRALSMMITGKETAKDVVWHPNGEIALVACTRSVKVFHCTGKYVENVAAASVPSKRGPMKLLLLPGNEQAVVLTDRAYCPFILHLATSQFAKANFMDIRASTAFQVRRMAKKGAGGSRADPFITAMAMRPHDTSAKLVATAAGQRVLLHSISTGTVGDVISVSADVTDLCFSSEHELLVTAQNKLLVYDIRKSATFVRAVVDEGSLATTRVAASPAFIAMGSSSGVVNIYNRGDAKPTKSLMNLSTSITSLAFGEGPHGPLLAVASSNEANGLRLVSLPSCAVVPSFPSVGARHKNIHSVGFHPTGSMLCVGEFGKVTNYALH